jgi:glycosyltransferase involved in cell wall biosynthesis
MDYRVAAFTDTYLPTVNGVTYTLQSWRDCWNADGGAMDVVYPGDSDYVPEAGEHPVRSVPFPFYEGFRVAAPRLPDAVRSADLDVVHAHTPFSLGLSGLRLSWRRGVPLVASYHTPAGEYAGYLGPTERIADAVRGTAETYERCFYDRAAVVLVPSRAMLRHLRSQVGIASRIEVVGNGVDVERFRPVAYDGFLARHGVPADRPLVGYTGRHGYEKDLDRLVDAVDGLDVTLAFGGDGPAREMLEARAAEADVDAHFLGFLDRDELPAFYSALDVFGFPSPVETQGLGALEANACGTPVVGVDSGALSDTVDDDVTGYHFPKDDVPAFRAGIRRALRENERLSANCLDRRESLSVHNSIERLAGIYGDLL